MYVIYGLFNLLGFSLLSFLVYSLKNGNKNQNVNENGGLLFFLVYLGGMEYFQFLVIFCVYCNSVFELVGFKQYIFIFFLGVVIMIGCLNGFVIGYGF